MALTPQQIADMREQAKIYKEMNAPDPASLPDKLKTGFRLLADKKRALHKLPYPVYPGKTSLPRTPESKLAEDLKRHEIEKGRPYNPLMEALAGLSGQDSVGQQRELQESLLADLLSQQKGFTSRIASQYGANPAFVLKDLERLRGLSAEKMLPLAEEGASLFSERQRQLSPLLKGLQDQQKGRHEAVLRELKKLGHLHKYHDKKEMESQKQEYEDQARYPWRQAALFEEELRPLLSITSQSPPELQQLANQRADMAQQALDTPYMPYQGKRVATLPASLKQAQEAMKRLLEPSVSSLTKQARHLVAGEDPERLKQFIFPHIQTSISDLEHQTEDSLHQQRQALDAKYIRLNQYGGMQHKLEQERMSRDLLKSLAQKQHSLLGEGYRQGIGAFHGEQMRKARSLGISADTRQQQFTQLKDALKTYRHQGTKDFLSGQQKLNAAYEDFKKQRQAQWPHLRQEMMTRPQNSPLMERRAR